MAVFAEKDVPAGTPVYPRKPEVPGKEPPSFEVKLSDGLEKDFSKGAGVEDMSPWKRSVARLALLLNSTNRGLIDYEAAQHFAKELMERTQRAVVPQGVDAEAANRIALAVHDYSNGINSEPLLYVINRILSTELHPLGEEGRRSLVHTLPSEWREVVVLLSDDLAAHLDYCFPNRTTYRRSREQYDHEMRNVYRARNLLYPETQESTSAQVSNTGTQTPAKAEMPGVVYWLLERQENGLSWYVNADTGRGSAWHWTTNVNAATRFGRKEDAAAWWNILSRHIGVGGSNTTDTQPSQHIFYPETPQ